MDDRAALQYHNPVDQPQNLLRVLLDNDRADAAGPGDGTECPQQFLDRCTGEIEVELVPQGTFSERVRAGSETASDSLGTEGSLPAVSAGAIPPAPSGSGRVAAMRVSPSAPWVTMLSP